MDTGASSKIELSRGWWICVGAPSPQSLLANSVKHTPTTEAAPHKKGQTWLA